MGHHPGITRRRKGADHTLAALKSIRAARRHGAPIYVILDYVPRNIIQVLCPAALCARDAWRLVITVVSGWPLL
jgi:hypothetical protein